MTYDILAALSAVTDNRLPESYNANKSFTTLKEKILGLYERTKTKLFEKIISFTPIAGHPSLYLEDILRTASKVRDGDEIVCHKIF